MGFNITGYILQKPRVGAANSPFTASPDDFDALPLSDPSSFGTDESNPGPVDYLTVVLVDGNLPDVVFGWTKNEGGIQRFDYDGSIGTFKPLPGGKRQVVGILGPDSNTTRLQVQKPSGSAPYRIAVGTIGSGTTFSVTTVVNDSAFGSPPTENVELSLDTGNLNWNTNDITTSYVGQKVLFQQQSSFSLKDSTGNLGVLGTDSIVLNPLPRFNQVPLIRFGFGLYLTPISVPIESALVNPPSGSFQWANDTGLIRFNSGDATANAGVPVYYDGILEQSSLTLPREILGTIGAPTPMSLPLPSVGGDLVFLAINGGVVQHQFSDFIRVPAFTTGVADQVQVRISDGQVQFSATDILNYGSMQAQVVIGDLLIERGITLRFFRSPVNPSGTEPTVKDLSAFYPTSEANLANPIIGAPMVFLPVLPIDDPTHPIVVEVQQGTGSFTGVLPRLDGPSPPAGIGYTIDFDGKQLNFAQRRNLEVIQIVEQVAALQLDPGITPSNAYFSLNQGAGYHPLILEIDTFLDTTSGVLTFVTKVGAVINSGSNGEVPIDSLVFTDLSADFSAVLQEDVLLLPAGPFQGIYTILGVPNVTGLTGFLGTTDSYLLNLFLGSQSQAPNFLVIDAPITVGAASLNYQVLRAPEVLADRSFQLVSVIDPNVTLSLVRGLTTTVLTPGKDYKVSADLGTFQTTARLVSLDQILITYPSSQDNPDPKVIPLVLTVNERATFLVRKELTSHPTPTSVISFNPKHRTVAKNPPPAVYRGGRPQDPSQYKIDYNPLNSTITFLADVLPTPSGFTKITDALPHGETVNPDENVYIDYNIYEALGGENTVSVLKPNLILIPVQIVEGASSFTVTGDQSTLFPANFILRIESDEVYYLAAPSYNPTTNLTTVNLLAPQIFRDSVNNPHLYMSTGDLLISPGQPQYFIPELATFITNPRGMNQFQLTGDHSGEYITGKIVYFSGLGFNDFYLVSGSSFDATSGNTTITLTQATAREYTTASFTLQKSIRPVYEANLKVFQTTGSPAVPIQTPPLTLLDTVIVYRKFPGQAGVILSSPLGFKIDDTGRVSIPTPLLPGESLNIIYTKHRVVNPGQVLASYTSATIPSRSNGLLNQILVDSFTTYIPDSFYIRVETMTNFRGQLAQQYKTDASSSSPSSGPRVDNASQPQLFQQGNASVFFEEGELANEDIVARITLKFYNDTIDTLEDILQNMDGRIVGDSDGRFRFDGTTGNFAPSIHLAGNQIDDIVSIAFGDVNQAYQTGTQSRFYPTLATVSQVVLQGTNTGDPILNFGLKPLTGSSPTVFKRFQRALITRPAKTGALTISVDTTAAVSNPPLRPVFQNSLLVDIADQFTIYVGDGSINPPLEIASFTPDSITFTAPLPTDIPAGATVYLSIQDVTYPPKSYRVGIDVTLDSTNGYLLYVNPVFPFTGQAPLGGDIIEGTVFFANLNTAPKKFPALLGQPFDDDGDQKYPLLNPSHNRELGLPGYLDTELTYVQSGTGSLAPTYIVDPFVGQGDLDVTKLIITLTVGNFSGTVPEEGDLVRILTGLNVNSPFHRVTTVTPNSVTVDVAFASVDSSFTFLVTAANDFQSGTTCTMAAAVLTDGAADFVTDGVQPGYTVIIMQPAHLSLFERRQVVTVDSATQLTLDQAFSNPVVGALYRISNPLNTFSKGDNLSELSSTVNNLIFILNNEISAVTNFYNSVFTDRLSPAVASGSITGSVLTGVSVDFIASQVQIGDYVYAPQPNEGIFPVVQVLDGSHLQLGGSPVGGAVNFRVVQAFGVVEKTLTDIFTQVQQTIAFRDATIAWGVLVDTPVPVLTPGFPISGDSRYFARGFTAVAILGREAAIIGRQTQLTNSISLISSIMSSSDRLYDKRFVWIDARINLQTGILVKEQRAVATRIKNQESILNSMLKLLAVQ